MDKKVGIAYHVMKIETIKEDEESFNIDFFLNLRWKDPSLIGLPEDKGAQGTVDLSDKWTPKVNFLNDIEVEQVFLNDRLVNSKEGIVERDLRYRGKFYNDFELHAFPFDSQVLEVQVVFYENFSLEMHENRILGFSRINSPEWERIGNGYSMDSATGSDGISSQVYKIEMMIKRKWQYHVWSSGSILFFLTFIGFSVFLASPSELMDRMGVSITTLLTIVALRITVAASLPKVPYLTIYDMYTLMSFVITSLSAIENAVVTKVDEDLAATIDKYSLIAFPAVWVLAHFVFLIMIFVAKRTESKSRKRYELGLFDEKAQKEEKMTKELEAWN